MCIFNLSGSTYRSLCTYGNTSIVTILLRTAAAPFPLPAQFPYIKTHWHCGCTSRASFCTERGDGRFITGVLRPEAMDELGESRRAGAPISERESREGSRVVSSCTAHLLGAASRASFGCSPWAQSRARRSCFFARIRDTIPARTRKPVTFRRNARSWQYATVQPIMMGAMIIM